MEIQLGLRSTEADGRTLGTGRPSTPPPDRNPAEALAARRAEQVDSRIAQAEKQESKIAERRAEGAERRSFEERLRAQRAETARTAQQEPREVRSDEPAHTEQQPKAEARGQAKPATGRATTTVAEAANQPSLPAQPVQASATAIPTGEASPKDAAPAEGQAKAARAALPTTSLQAQPQALAAPAPVEGAVAFGLGDELQIQEADAAPATAIQGAQVETAGGRATQPQEARSLQARDASQTAVQAESVETARVDESVRPQAQAQEARAAARERAADMLRQIGVQLSPATRTALIDLYPKELGRIHIRISVDEGRVRASLRAEKKETLETLEKHLPELRDQLSRAGLEAQELSLSLGFDGGRRGGAHGEARGERQTNLTDLRPATAVELASLSRRVARDGGVDTFA